MHRPKDESDPGDALRSRRRTTPTPSPDIPDPRAIHKCAAPWCPGYSYKASDLAHPADTCGANAPRAIWESLTPNERVTLGSVEGWIDGVEETNNYWLAAHLDKLVKVGLLECTARWEHGGTFVATDLGRAVAAAGKAGA